MQVKLEIIKGDKTEVKTFTSLNVKTKTMRKALALIERVDFFHLKAKDLDDVVDYICEVYHNQFTREEFYDGLDANLLTETLDKALNDIVDGAKDRLDTFPSK